MPQGHANASVFLLTEREELRNEAAAVKRNDELAKI